MRGFRSGRHGDERLDRVVRFLVLIGDERGVQRLRQLRAVAIERVGFQREAPREHVGALAILDRRVVRHVDGLGDRARDEGLRRRHHADVAVDRKITLADAAARIGAVEDRVMLGLEMRSALESHRAANVDVGGLDIGFREAEIGQDLEGRIVELVGRDFQRAGEEVLAERPFVEHELDVEGALEALLDRVDLVLREALGGKRAGIDRGRLAHGAVAERIDLDLGDLGLAVAEGAQAHRARRG